ncbi:hypothetical protein B0H10DRAFT_1793883, partial [Mycena sp. CBHHK59/15]
PFKKSTQNLIDKSKGDAPSKGVVLLQGMWFVAQCISHPFLGRNSAKSQCLHSQP